MTDQVIEHLMDIKERLSVIETKVDSQAQRSEDRDEKVDKIEKKVIKAEASIKTVKWISGLLLISLPATAAAIFKIWKP